MSRLTSRYRNHACGGQTGWAKSHFIPIIRGNPRICGICLSFPSLVGSPMPHNPCCAECRTQIPQIRGLLADNMGRSAPGEARRLHGFLRFHRIPRISRIGAATHPDGLCVICGICEPIPANPEKSHLIPIIRGNPRVCGICGICVRPFPGKGCAGHV